MVLFHGSPEERCLPAGAALLARRWWIAVPRAVVSGVRLLGLWALQRDQVVEDVPWDVCGDVIFVDVHAVEHGLVDLAAIRIGDPGVEIAGVGQEFDRRFE